MFMFSPSKLSKAVKNLIVYIPFTRRNIITRSIDKSTKTLLDLGCGDGETMGFINKGKKLIATGVDAHQPYLTQCKLRGIYAQLHCCDIRSLPFEPKSFDVVMCLQVLEHLENEEGVRLLRQIEQIARRQVILDIPVGKWEQGAFEDNSFQRHKSAWYPIDLKNRGYKIRGYDVIYIVAKFLYGLPNRFKLAYYLVSLLVGPFVYYLPRLAGAMVGVKYLSSEGEK